MNYNILIIDDKEPVFERYKSSLNGYTNLSLKHAGHGPAAIEMIKSNTIHLIFLDQIFSDESIAVDKLYRINNEQIVTCNPTSERENLTTYINNQGLYILQKLRQEGYTGPIIFVTDVADEEDIEKIRIGPKAKSLGADDYLPKSSGLTEINLTKIIKAHLKLSNLRSIRQEISYLIENGIEDRSLIINKMLLIDELGNEATSRRRMGIPFVKEVIKELNKENYISIGTFSEVLKKISNKDEWQFEEINPRELLEWVLSKCDSLKKYKAENWDYEGTNGVRYGYRYRNGNEVFYLRIVHPKFASNIQDINSLKTNSSREGYFEWVDLDKYNYELESNDPYWQGNHINIYLEKGNNGALIKEYVSEKAPLDSKDIKEILEKTKAIICASEPEWHGAISIESIYIKVKETIAGGFGHFRTERNVTISDYPLYNLLNEEGRNAIKGLSLGDKKKRDIQAFGQVADFVVSGIDGESVNILNTKDAYFSFVNQCTTGEWVTTQPIPDSPSHVRIIPRGYFRSGLEEYFFYRIKTELVNKKCSSIVFINANINFKTIKNNVTYHNLKEIDFIVLLPNQIYIIDTKGNYIDRVFDALREMPENLTKFRSIVSTIDHQEYYKKADFKIVLADEDYDKIQNNINITDKSKVCSIATFCDEIKGMSIYPFYDLNFLEDHLKNNILSSNDSPYEFKEEFINRFGNIVSTQEGREYDELHTEDYYIRRYSMLHALDIDNVKYSLQRGIQEHKLSEKILNYNSSGYILLPISPDGTMFVDRGGAPIQNNLVEVKADKTDKNRIKIYVRWIYKFYKKPDKDFEGPFLLKHYIGTIQENENEKEKLLYHYFKAIDTLSILQINDNLNVGFDENSLKVFKKGNTYTGVLEPSLNNGFQNEDVLRDKVLLLIGILKPDSYELQRYKDEINASKDSLVPIIRKYIDWYEKKDKIDKILDVGNEILTMVRNIKQPVDTKSRPTFPNNKNKRRAGSPHHNNTHKPTTSTQETTPVVQFQNHQEKKVEAESISIKPPEKQTQGRLEGTIKLLAFSVDFNSVNEEKRREQFRCDFINNIKNGQLVKIGYPKQSSGVYSGMIWILNEQQHNTAKDVQDVTIASEPIMEYGSIVFQGKGYMFRKDAISPEDLKGLHEGGKVSFILNKGDIVKDIKIIPS